MNLKYISNTLKVIISVIITLCVMYTAYSLYRSQTDNINTVNEIKKLKIKLDSIQYQNQYLLTKVDGYEFGISKINNKVFSTYAKIDIINKDILTIKRNTSEKTNSIDSFDNSDIYLFFSERYQSDNNECSDCKINN